MTTQLSKFGQQYVAKGVNRLSNAVMKSGKGSYAFMDDGRKMLDFTSGIAVTGLGHCHPKVTEAATKQINSLVHTSCSISFTEPYLNLIQKLQPMMPHSSLDSFFFWNSGAEAVEASVKLARVATGRQNIIAMQGGYHGRTIGTMSLTRSKTIYSEGHGPLMAGVYVTPYPYWHQLNLPPTTSAKELTDHALFQLDMLLKQQSAPKDTAAILIEPLLGEGGYVAPPSEFMHELRAICDKHGILLICDEVQCGFARTGTMFMSESLGVRPDIMIMAKAIANGFPLSAIASRKELMDRQPPGTMGGTYAGNAVSCAAANAVMDVLKEEKILDNVNDRAKQLWSHLHSLQKSASSKNSIIDVRGKGLMVGVEFATPSGHLRDTTGVVRSGVPASLAAKVSKKCMEKGMLILTTSVYEVVRFIPPLNVSESEMKEGCEIFSQSVEEAVNEA